MLNSCMQNIKSGRVLGFFCVDGYTMIWIVHFHHLLSSTHITIKARHIEAEQAQCYCKHGSIYETRRYSQVTVRVEYHVGHVPVAHPHARSVGVLHGVFRISVHHL